MPAKQKERLKARAKEQAISLGELMRRIVDKQIALHHSTDRADVYNFLPLRRP